MFFGEQISFFIAWSAKKWIWNQTDVRNLFRNIEWPLEYIIMALETYLESTDEETCKKVVKI